MILQHSQQIMAQHVQQAQAQIQSLLQQSTSGGLAKPDFLIDAFSNANQSTASRNFTSLLDNIPGEVRPVNADASQNSNSSK